MTWTSEWGPQLKKLIEIEQVTGKTPQALENIPVCYGLEREMVLAFNYLTARRQVGFAANPISLHEIQSYVQIFGPPPMPMDIFIDLLGLMDNTYLDKLNKSHGHSSSHHPPGKR